MPPSPALRFSPGREMRTENHKRGQSLEGGLVFKEKNDDLALFNEMQSREREDFLLQSSDDFEDTFSIKLRNFSDFKHRISIPTRGESSELLNTDRDKNDYDWLLTPPETPLFPSLDDEPQLDNAAHRGRPRSKPITITRSSTMEKSYRSSRGSASPNRLTPSPRSGNSTFQSRGRQSSTARSSPTPSVRSATPTRRPSPPPNKPATSAPRSSTPTSRRSSVGAGSSGIHGTSPIKTSRGNSLSPKVKAWQSNIPGFSTDAPPNLRTSLADRPASYMRGSSPASMKGRDSTSRASRQSMSPTASRSVSSHSHDRDRFSSYSKGSVVSSGEDDVDSVESVTVGSLDRAISKRAGAVPSNRALAFSKKSNKILSPSSTPKRSFDSALRKMDHSKTPQNMFRPLLSSVPSSTFYAGKSSSVQHSLLSRNSSVTTSSNASSDRGIAVALDVEASDRHDDDMISEFGKAVYSNGQEEIFSFDNMEMLNPHIEHASHDDSLDSQLVNFDRDSAIACNQGSTFIAAPIPYEDLSYGRDSASSFRNSIGHDSAFSSSSVDFGSAKHMEAQMQRQFSGKKFDGDNYGHDSNIKPPSVVASSSGVSNHVCQASCAATSSIDIFDVSVDDIEYQVEETPLVSEARVNVSENKETNVMDTSLNDSDTSISELSSHMDNFHLEENPVVPFSNYEDCVSHEIKEGFSNSTSNVFDGEEVSDGPLDSSLDENAILGSSPDGKENVVELATHNSLTTISEIEMKNGCQDTSDSQIDDNINLKSNTNESEECSAPAHQDAVISDHAHDISEDSTVLVECRGQSKSRSLTLEEATDTILFCSSIVQDLAFRAATIAIEKEYSAPLEISQPAVTILGRSNSYKKDPCSRPVVGKQRNSKSQKTRHKQVETQTDTTKLLPSSKTENDENVNEPMMRNVGLPNKADDMKPPPKLESKCNCTIM